MAAGSGLLSAFSSSGLRSALRAVSQAPVAVGAAVVAGAAGATLLIGFDGGGSSVAPERVEMAQSGDGSTTGDAEATGGPAGGSGDAVGDDSPDEAPDDSPDEAPDDSPSPDAAPDAADEPAITPPSPSPSPTPETDSSTAPAPDGGVTRTGGSGPGDGPTPEPPAPPSLVGSVRLLAGGVAVARTVTLTLRDVAEDEVATRTVDTTADGAAFEFQDVAPGDYTLELSGPGIVARTTGTLTVPSVGTTLDVGTEDLVTTTTVTGTVLGFAGSPLALAPLGVATVTFPDEAQPGVPAPFTVETDVDGTFSATIRSGNYAAGTITVGASGHETRSLGGAVADATAVLPGMDGLFLLYAVTPGADELVLDPAPRSVMIQVDLVAVGAEVQTRPLTVQLLDGEISPGVAVQLPDGTLAGDLDAVPGSGANVGGVPGVVSTADVGVFDLSGVPVGSYTLRISGEGVRTVEQPLAVQPASGIFLVGTVEVRVACGTPGAVCEVGDTGPGGGIVFYVAPAGGTFAAAGTACGDSCRYLEAWIANAGSHKWKTSATTTLGTSTEIGSGFSNTYTRMEGAEHPAAAAARSATHGGKDDWFLPSKDELDELSKRREIIGGNVNGIFWSSSEHSATQAWTQNFGIASLSRSVSSKDINDFLVRPIRAF